MSVELHGVTLPRLAHTLWTTARLGGRHSPWSTLLAGPATVGGTSRRERQCGRWLEFGRFDAARPAVLAMAVTAAAMVAVVGAGAAPAGAAGAAPATRRSRATSPETTTTTSSSYVPGALPDQLWDFEEFDLVIRPLTISGTFKPIVGDFTNDKVEDIFWYSPGPAPDYRWDFNSSGDVHWTSKPYAVGGTAFVPGSGNLSGDGADDIVWFNPGAAGDYIWDFNTGGGYTNRPISVGGSYRPILGRFGDDDVEDIFWYSPGSGRDYLWEYSNSSFRYQSFSDSFFQVGGAYQSAVVDAFGDGQDDIAFLASGAAPDYLWDFAGRSVGSIPLPEADVAFTDTDGLDTWNEDAGELWLYDGNSQSGRLIDFFIDEFGDPAYLVGDIDSAPVPPGLEAAVMTDQPATASARSTASAKSTASARELPQTRAVSTWGS